MSPDVVCRICLRGVVDMRYSIEDVELRREYMKLVGTMVHTEDKVTKSICFICHAHLKKNKIFSKMALKSQSILATTVQNAIGKVTLDNITAINTNIRLTQHLSTTPIQCLCVDNDSQQCCVPYTLQPYHQYVYSYVRTNDIVDIKEELVIKEEITDDAETSITPEDLHTEDGTKITQSISRETNYSSCFTCDICGKEFGTIHLLKSHIISHSNEKPFSCKKCKRTFSRKHNMVQHRKICSFKNRKSEVTNRNFVCNVCSKNFVSKNNLTSHLVTHSEVKPYTCVGCKKCFARKQGMKKHTKICSKVEPQTYSCKYCNRTFSSASDLKSHWISNTAEKPFTCCKCKKPFVTKPNLKVHMKICFLQNEAVHCNLCTEVYNSRTELCKHLNSTHNEEKPFICDRCSKKFWHKSALKAHMRSHTGEKPYACEICGKMFKVTTHLKTHIMCTHTQNKPFSCHICGKAFSGKWNLKDHLRCHTGERPFACNTCGKSFGHQSTLRHHRIKIHTEGKRLPARTARRHTLRKAA